ncbi:hypothetical protein IPM65_04850 [Candidatus Roizmanbacteria bacterium]|nr:MAG: hypothetical protein IPM65_04850 [Candidatus Roizmanbacteria bacterium]
MTEHIGYRAPTTLHDIKSGIEQLHSIRNPDVGMPLPVKLFHLSHSAPKEGATRPGIDPLFAAFAKASALDMPNVAVSMADHSDPSAQAEEYTAERQAMNITLNRVLERTPGFTQSKEAHPLLAGMTTEELMKRHGDTVHIMAYLNSHDEATRSSLRHMGITDPDEFLAAQVDETDLEAAAFVDAAVGSWLINNIKPQDLLVRDDWPPANVHRDLKGNMVLADIGDNHGIVPSLKAIQGMHPKLQEYQFRLFGNMLTGNSVLGLHTDRDIRNILEIADHLYIPEDRRAVMYKRYLMPPSFIEFRPTEELGKTPAPFLEKAVHDGKVIAQVVERLDPIKDDYTALSHFEAMIRELAGHEQGREVLENLRIGWIGRPARFPEGWKSKSIYDAYTGGISARLDRVNALFREVMQTEDDFILVHRDAAGNLSGYQHDKLKTEVYPFSDITFQVGQEGLCQTIQEGVLTKTFGMGTPGLTVVSDRVGFAEKATEQGLENTHVISDMNRPDGFINAFVNAYQQALVLRNGNANLRDAMTAQLKGYYDTLCKDTFYGTAIDTLVEVERSKQK